MIFSCNLFLIKNINHIFSDIPNVDVWQRPDVKLLMFDSEYYLDSSTILRFLQVCIMFADAEAIGHDKCASVRDTSISHNERPTGSTSDKAGKVAEKTVAGMLHVTHTHMLISLYQQTTYY